MRTITREMQADMTPKQALQILMKGNVRFQDNLKANRNLLEQAQSTSEGQHPFAAVLSCIDSRTSAELIFDQGLGDIFSIRIAGNILNDDILGSMEFSCKMAGAKLIVVMGHTSCGAIKGAHDGLKIGFLTGLLQKIYPAVDFVKTHSQGPAAQTLDTIAAKNVEYVVNEIPNRSKILKEMIAEDRVAVVGGMYSVKSGAFTLLGEKQDV